MCEIKSGSAFLIISLLFDVTEAVAVPQACSHATVGAITQQSSEGRIVFPLSADIAARGTVQKASRVPAIPRLAGAHTRSLQGVCVHTRGAASAFRLLAVKASEVMAMARARHAARSAPPVGDLVITLREEGLRGAPGRRREPEGPVSRGPRPNRGDPV